VGDNVRSCVLVPGKVYQSAPSWQARKECLSQKKPERTQRKGDRDGELRLIWLFGEKKRGFDLGNGDKPYEGTSGGDLGGWKRDILKGK